MIYLFIDTLLERNVKQSVLCDAKFLVHFRWTTNEWFYELIFNNSTINFTEKKISSKCSLWTTIFSWFWQNQFCTNFKSLVPPHTDKFEVSCSYFIHTFMIKFIYAYWFVYILSLDIFLYILYNFKMLKLSLLTQRNGMKEKNIFSLHNLRRLLISF